MSVELNVLPLETSVNEVVPVVPKRQDYRLGLFLQIIFRLRILRQVTLLINKKLISICWAKNHRSMGRGNNQEA